MTPFKAEIEPSKTALIVVIFLHIWFLCVWALYFEWFVLGIFFACLSFVYTLKEISWYATKNSITAIYVEPRGEVSLRFGTDQTLFKAKMLDCSVACRFALILHFKVIDKKRCVVIFPDSVSQEGFRQLMVYTRWCGFEIEDQSPL